MKGEIPVLESEAKDYNSRRPQMVIPEYGRNIQKMVEFAFSVTDREERNQVAKAIINVMGNLNPHLRDVPDFKHKLWDHLFIISNYQLDADSPYPKPEPEVINEKPERVDYPQSKIRFKHYGKIVQSLIQKACETEDEKEKQEMTHAIANLMKKSYLVWNKDSVDDDVILGDLSSMSDGKLTIASDFELDSTPEILSKNKPKGGFSQANKKRHHGKKRKNRR